MTLPTLATIRRNRRPRDTRRFRRNFVSLDSRALVHYRHRITGQAFLGIGFAQNTTTLCPEKLNALSIQVIETPLLLLMVPASNLHIAQRSAFASDWFKFHAFLCNLLSAQTPELSSRLRHTTTSAPTTPNTNSSGQSRLRHHAKLWVLSGNSCT